ncbi:MAG: SxtJ family membrane protein [Bacteroidota bacterium]
MIVEEIKNIKSDKAEIRKFGITVGIVLLIIGGVLFLLGKASFPYLLISGVTLIILGLTSTSILKPIQKLWMMLAVVLGFFMSRLILLILFYLVVTPIGFLGGLFGKDFIDEKFDKSKSSYWNYRDSKEYTPTETERQF